MRVNSELYTVCSISWNWLCDPTQGMESCSYCHLNNPLIDLSQCVLVPNLLCILSSLCCILLIVISISASPFAFVVPRLARKRSYLPEHQCKDISLEISLCIITITDNSCLYHAQTCRALATANHLDASSSI